MESGNLSKRIELKGNDELTDLASSLNNFAKTMEDDFHTLEKIKKEQLETVASLSHDLRTPLTSVMSYIQFIIDEKYSTPTQLKEYAQKAYEKSYRIKEMSDRLFESCTANTERKAELTEVNCKNFISQIFFEFEDILENIGFTISSEINENCAKSSILIDTEKSPRIFDNIVSNIEKYANKDFPVMLSAYIKDSNLIIHQKNTSISENQKQFVESNLFGLNNVKKVVSNIGGTVSVSENNNIFSLEISIPVYKQTEFL